MKILPLLLCLLIAVPAMANPPEVSVGAQGAWFDQGDLEAQRDIEASGRAVLSLTPHLSAVGGIAYGFSNSYVRGSLGARATVTDNAAHGFSIGVGFARHFESEPGHLDEWCGEAGVGWQPFSSSPLLATASCSVGLDTSRRLFTAGVTYPIHIVGGAR